MRVLITGANRGFGRAVAVELISRGHDVVAATRTALDIGDPMAATSITLDVQVQTSIEIAAAQYAGRHLPLDVLVNNAGIYNADGSGYDPARPSQQLHTLTVADATKLYEVNAIGPLMITQAFTSQLTGTGRPQGPLIINVSSRVGSATAAVEGGDFYYSPSKAALNMVTRRLAADLRPKVTVVAVDPGWLRTGAGGHLAPGDAATAAGQFTDLIDSLTPADSGRFMNLRGDDLPF